MERLTDKNESRLAYLRRVLAEIERDDRPLLERARFAALFEENAEEFAAHRVEWNKPKRRDRQLQALGEMRQTVMMWIEETLLPSFKTEGIRIEGWQDMTASRRREASELLEKQAGKPVPISAEEFAALDGDAVILAALEGETLRLLKRPAGAPWLLDGGDGTLWSAAELDAHNAEPPLHWSVFRVVCRDAEDEGNRRAALLLCGRQADRTCRYQLRALLSLPEKAVMAEGPTWFGCAAMGEIARLPGFSALRFPAFTPRMSQAAEDMFERLRRETLLLLHPYDSFEPVVRLVEQAAEDGKVTRLEISLYRVAEHSQIVAALEKAAKNGIQVTAVVEIQARGEAARNADVSARLEAAGCTVVRGKAGLRVHVKALLVTRMETEGEKRYVDFGTGNYNEDTARCYVDASLLTSEERYGADARRLFDYLEGEREEPDCEEITVSPFGLRAELLRLIRREMGFALRKQPSGIRARLNALTDETLIEALMDASRAGVPIDLTVRGVCCLRPGVKGETENIRVRSIVGRFLEHARVLEFGCGDRRVLYLSSADWMARCMKKRVELLVPVSEPDTDKDERLSQLLKWGQADTEDAWLLEEDAYTALRTTPQSLRISSQAKILKETIEDEGWREDE